MQKAAKPLNLCNSVTPCNGANECGVTAFMPMNKGFFAKCNTVTPFPVSKRVGEKNKIWNKYYIFTTIDVIKAQALRCYTHHPALQKTRLPTGIFVAKPCNGMGMRGVTPRNPHDGGPTR